MSTVRFVVLLLAFPALVALERFAYYAVRSHLFLFMRDPTSEGGLGMSIEQLATTSSILSAMLTAAPLLGGVIAIGTGPRITMVAGALLGIVT